ncbi:MAG: TIGR03862 family flavoprotein [Bdellovibrionales bacterium]|nr:TIGR03862 family flavoprotein [Bdellovibrionales bacterium]
MKNNLRVAVVGTGPSALMAADVISSAGISVSIFEKRKGPARKLLIAGSSGLNVTFNMPLNKFCEKYSGPSVFWKRILNNFTPQDWLSFINELGIKTFKGTSERYFVEGMKAVKLVAAWKKKLSKKGVSWYFNHECIDFKIGEENRTQLWFKSEPMQEFDAIVFSLGGASWEEKGSDIEWPQMFINQNLSFTPFSASNVGFKVNWSQNFLKEAEGFPFKNIVLKSNRGSLAGDVVVTSYGVEGTPVYAVGEKGDNFLDLKPDLTEENILDKVLKTKENLSPLRKVQRHLKLCPASMALLFHETQRSELKDLNILVKRIKCFPITFVEKEGLLWAISSAGGLEIKELDSQLMLKKHPGIFAAGEMLDWDTITGGFLIQACVSQGFLAGQGVVSYLASKGRK